ncbi:hypothetical protein KZZ52_15305 [Dactylosporangium sp. AC04546]|uniref:hypothetical protein n=1 Tax=Dactylosporangium sp. AC04546 TaxID=2862460 RepID=UPI001EE154CE|nr:hypothetical protein [Dactylosporangium sp. AC04546]WVK86674.1 hypothetical protein KZZ52_15305 [Dactylosporangium sp. AC04546]
MRGVIVPDDESRAIACHWMLLRLSGELPDDLATQCRAWLARGRELDLGRAVARAVLAQRTPLTGPDLGLLAELLVEAGMDASALSMVDVASLDQVPRYGFVSSRAMIEGILGGDVGAGPPAMPAGQGQEQVEDVVESGALAAVAGEPGALALWRSWRFPSDGAPWPPPKRVFVVEVDEAADPVGITDRVQGAVAAAGEAAPQVEVYPRRAELPGYQRLARAYGALLWATVPDSGVKIAVLFDRVDPQAGPRMHPDHPKAAGAERERLLGYLRRGEPLLVTTARMDDVVDTALQAAVPMNFVTDGVFIWTDASTYYLERHGLLPDPELVEHIRARDYQPAPVDGAAVHRALAALQEPATEEPAWTYGGRA